MSYKALLFCPDEASARQVTQVLSELDFTVELSFEPFVTVKKLGEETYDALVVDCANEQNASVLFKGARSSSLNHSSLCVAVAEGQAGLANAFRIGANLVLTKPINIEQSKNTLRVARGLLRKNAPPGHAADAAPQSKPVAPTSSSAPASYPASPAPTPSAPIPPAVPAMAAPVPAPSMPTSLLEAEQKRSQPAASPFASAPRPSPTTSFGAGSTGFAAAAPALAPERIEPAPTIESKPFREMPTASPLVTNEPIVPEATIPVRPQPAVPVPTFSSYAHRPAAKSGGGSKAIWIIPVLLLVGAAGYFGWKKYQPMQYLHGRNVASSATQSNAQAQPEVTDSKPSPSVDATTQPQSAITAPVETTASAPSESKNVMASSAASSTAAEGFPTKEHIDISAPTETPEKPATVVSKPEPVQVSRKAASVPKMQEQPVAPPAPPALVITGTNPADTTIAGLVATNAVVPKAAPTTLRISQGITQGLLMKRVPPTYPPGALQLRREGTVELLAKISKSGAISNVKVLSGDPTLAKAAVEGVKQWKYRPYLLNGEPVEIETQISMIFRLPH
jgi:periplasmic protein TonB